MALIPCPFGRFLNLGSFQFFLLGQIARCRLALMRTRSEAPALQLLIRPCGTAAQAYTPPRRSPGSCNPLHGTNAASQLRGRRSRPRLLHSLVGQRRGARDSLFADGQGLGQCHLPSSPVPSESRAVRTTRKPVENHLTSAGIHSGASTMSRVSAKQLAFSDAR